MPEASKDAAILIATSYQALKRAEKGDKSTELTNCMVIILFAGFFVEENLNVIIKAMKKQEEMRIFLDGKKYSGLLDKISWFYNEYIESTKSVSRRALFKKDVNGELLILRKLETRFQGITEIYEFRNKIAHGKIKAVNIIKAERLRKHAKAIVDELFKIAQDHEFKIPRNITYQAAIVKQ